MYLESYMSRVLDIPKYTLYRANKDKDKDKDKINLVYFVSLFTTNLFRMTSNACHTHQLNSPDECGKHCLSYMKQVCSE